MLRSSQQGQEEHSQPGLTDNLTLSVSRPAKLLNHEGQTWSLGYGQTHIHQHTLRDNFSISFSTKPSDESIVFGQISEVFYFIKNRNSLAALVALLCCYTTLFVMDC